MLFLINNQFSHLSNKVTFLFHTSQIDHQRESINYKFSHFFYKVSCLSFSSQTDNKKDAIKGKKQQQDIVVFTSKKQNESESLTKKDSLLNSTDEIISAEFSSLLQNNEKNINSNILQQGESVLRIGILILILSILFIKLGSSVVDLLSAWQKPTTFEVNNQIIELNKKITTINNKLQEKAYLQGQDSTTVISVVAPTISAIQAAFLSSAQPVWQIVQNKVLPYLKSSTVMIKAQTLLMPVYKAVAVTLGASPFAWIAFFGVTCLGFIYVFSIITTKISEFFSFIYNKINSFISSFMQKIANFFSDLIDSIKQFLVDCLVGVLNTLDWLLSHGDADAFFQWDRRKYLVWFYNKGGFKLVKDYLNVDAPLDVQDMINLFA